MLDRLSLGSFGVLVGAVAASSCSNDAADDGVQLGDESDRNGAFARAIQDAGYLCNEVIGADGTKRVVRSWRVVCNDAMVYVAMLDDDDAMHIAPTPYFDAGPAVEGRSVELDNPRHLMQ